MGRGVAFYEREQKLNSQFIELPITLQMRTNEIGYMRYGAHIGFMPAILISSRGEYTVAPKGSGVVSDKSDDDRDFSGETNSLLTYLVIGVHTTYNLGGSTSLLGGVTFNNGFTNLWKNKNNNPADVAGYYPYNIKPAYIALNMGVQF